MARGGAEKTEKPTPKRRAEARKRGQVARSPDLNASVILLVALFVLGSEAPAMVQRIGDSMRQTLMLISTPQIVTSHGLIAILKQDGTVFASVVAPIAAASAAVGVIASVGQVKWKPSLELLRPDPKRLNPVNGAKQLFSPEKAFDLGKNLVKVAAIGAIVAFAIVPQLSQLASLVGLPPARLLSSVASNVLSIGQRAAAAYLVVAIVDYVHQRRRIEKSLKMDKQEIKEEAKQHAPPAEVRSAIRRRQMQAARARMMAAVPEADVVVTNPTHYAVALRYDGTKPAPEVVAKGQDLVAAQIKRIAEENAVPVISDPPLARSLYSGVEVGHQIPEELFAAVAQVLAFVYRVAGRRAV